MLLARLNPLVFICLNRSTWNQMLYYNTFREGVVTMLEDELKQSLVFALRNARTHQAISLMGFNRVDFLLLQALIETDAPWTVASLAHYIQQPTASVQRRLESSLACGTVNRVGDKGIVLTERRGRSSAKASASLPELSTAIRLASLKTSSTQPRNAPKHWAFRPPTPKPFA